MSIEFVKLAIADDHPLFRAALTQAAKKSLPFSEIIEAESFNSIIDVIQENPDIELIFLDLNMPGNDGFTGLATIRNAYPDIQVVMVSATEEANIINRAIDLGASGYIPKSASLDEISDAIDFVLDGETWLPPGINLSTEAPSEEKEIAEKLSKLTPAQYRVLQMIADGLLNKQIAYEMNIQEPTVKNHVSAILQKFEVNNRTQASTLFQKLKQTSLQPSNLN
ncbi:response regulator transcription factor [Thalassotalea castellviae]|uniref:Response regulator transcription factor n=1 Tax=Thalassotalea castellviae TaxID=3075612 RepID=A0ABU3A1S2_9GAMM|nr:response regulator transcription factor [Thalassotalea sp. W431]MDT0604133.1 response regulator transcription factor [Thalassotalea sp. W431]